MVSVEFNRFLNYYKRNVILLLKESERSSEPREIRAGDPVRYFINIGARDDFDWMQLKDFLKETLELGRDDVFKVDVKEGFSFFNTDGEHTEKVMETLNGYDLNGRRINVEISKTMAEAVQDATIMEEIQVEEDVMVDLEAKKWFCTKKRWRKRWRFQK